jgi:UPF0716 protein FxsA
MVRRGFWLYVVVELAAAAALFSAVGPGWALVVLLATFLLGLVLVGSQFRRQVAALRTARGNPEGAVADGLLVGLGGALMLIPGLVSSALGALMLLPPTRSAVRPVATAMLTRGVTRRMGALNLGSVYPGPARGGYIDGEVVDGEVVDGAVVPDGGAAEQMRTLPRGIIARRTDI